MKRVVLFLLLISGILFNLTAQEITGKSSSYSFYITKEPPKPPFLEINKGSLEFVDSDENKMIDANEHAQIRFQLINTGSGPGVGLVCHLKDNSNSPGIEFQSAKTLGTLQPGESMDVTIPVTANMNTRNGKAIFTLTVDESNDFGTDPVIIEIPTRAFISPEVKIVDWKVTSTSGTTIQKKRPFDLQIMVQNVGQGIAEDVKVNLPVPKDMYCLSDNAVITLGTLKPGETKLVEYNLITTNTYTLETIPLNFKLNERFDKYAQNHLITLNMNQKVSDTKLVIEGKKEENVTIKIASLTSAVDKNIPYNDYRNPNRIALIIGNEHYAGSSLNAEINVDFAINDADIFRKYVVNLLGVPEDNIYFLKDATAGVMHTKIELVSKLLQKIGPKSELIFYYAGHGYPDPNNKEPYLIPVDVNATDLSSAIKLSEIYQQFSRSGAGRITFFLDACFSGGGRNQGLLAARAVKIKPKSETLSGNMVVFSASSGEQSALANMNEKHGMFTYYLLKKLKEARGNIKYGELADYLKYEVPIESLKQNGKEQDPEVNISTSVMEVWKNWGFIKE